MMIHMKSHHGNNQTQSQGQNNDRNSRNNNFRSNNQTENRFNQNHTAPACRFWMQGNCFRGMNCRFSHPVNERLPVMCPDGDYCAYWPRCKYSHGDEIKMCYYQDRCVRQDCQFAHGNPDFLGIHNNRRAPNLMSHQEFPPFPHQMGSPWRN